MKSKARMERSLGDYFLLMLLFPVYLISKVIPKDKNLYIFGSSQGLQFADNSKYLFIYTSRNIKTAKSVFITRNKKIAKTLASNLLNSEYLFSFRGIWTVLRARTAFISYSDMDINPLLMGGTEIIQLWHGTPLKKIGNDKNHRTDDFKGNLKSFIRTIMYNLFPYLMTGRSFDKIIITSDFVRESYLSSFGRNNDDLVVIGNPRNDGLLIENNFNKHIFPEIENLEQLRAKSQIIISWLPTYRLPAPVTIVDLMKNHGFDNKLFNELLENNNALLIIKAHAVDNEILQDKIQDSDRIIAYKEIDPYPLLRYTNILITDYSSVYFDFLLLNRPIIFTPFDYDEYIKTNGSFYYDYNKVTPGPKCHNWNDVALELEKTIAFLKDHNNDPYFEKRAEVNDKFNYNKENFCKRVADRFIETGKA